MAELIRFELTDLPVCRIIGREAAVENGQNPLPPLWSRCFGDGTFEKLEQMTDSLFPDALYDAADAYLDWCDGKRCIVGMVMKPGTVPPEGFDFAELPACQLALGQVKGTESEVYAEAERLMLPLIEQAGKIPGNFMIEVYACPRFTTPAPDGTVILDYYLQVK